MRYPVTLTRIPSHPQVVERPRLDTLHDDASGVAIVGPAGSGKTVVAAARARARGARILWCRLTADAGTGADLVGLARQAGGEDARTSDAPPATTEELAAALLEVLEPEPTTLVVDDHHAGVAHEIDPVLAEVLLAADADTRLILTSRHRPARLVGQAGLRLITADDLRFTPEEAAELFADRGRPDDALASSWATKTDGWATAVAVAAETGAPIDTDVAQLLGGWLPADLDEPQRIALDALTALPYLTADLAGSLGVGDRDILARLTTSTGLVTETAGSWRLHAALRDARLDPADQDTRRLRERAAAQLAETDPGTAVDLLIEIGDYETAAGVLSASTSRFGPDRALEWLYRIPPELRKRLPPVLSGGQATVDYDQALDAARQRLESAASSTARREALFGLGSVQASRGHLSDAADALERALVGATDRAGAAPDALTRRTATLLGLVRLWSQDPVGAAAAFDLAGPRVWALWGRGQSALADGDLRTAARAAEEAVDAAATDDGGGGPAPGHALAAQVALLDGDLDAAAVEARRAYEAGLESGGHELAVGATALAWTKVRTEAHDEALDLCDLVDRRVARNDRHALLQVELVRAAVAAASGRTGAAERAERRVQEIRADGFAATEAIARAALWPLGAQAPGATVSLLGGFRVTVDGRHLAVDGWRSRKAAEVLAFVVTRPGRRARREEIIEAVWPDRDPSRGRTLLRTALAEVRKVLEPDRVAGEASRFVTTSGDEVTIEATTDIDAMDSHRSSGQTDQAFALARQGVAPEFDSDWWVELDRHLVRLRTELAERVADDQSSPQREQALTCLVEAEPWNRDHVDRLARFHRDAGDEPAARAVERRWFEGDG